MKTNSSDSNISIKNLTDDEVGNIVAKFKYLAEGWLDSYERKIFTGKKVNELLNKLEETAYK